MLSMRVLNSWNQITLLPQPLEELGRQAYTQCSAYNLPLFYNCSETLGLEAPRHYFPVQLCNQSNRERLVFKFLL